MSIMSTDATPDTLWHYTDAQGLYGIVSGSRLRFGDARFLNDRTERKYGALILEAVFDEVVRNDSTGAAADFRNLTRALNLNERLYVCSLSANKESISQWQRYGADGNGYCIGFATRELDEILDDDRVSRDAMIYDETVQREALRLAILSGLRQYRQIKEERHSREDYYAYLFTDMDIRAIELQMKNPFFHDEQEWRYFLTGRDDDEDLEPADPDRASEADPDDDIVLIEPKELFSPRGHYIKPYVELPLLRNQFVKKLPITTVVCGPRLDGDVALPTVRRFLRSRGHYATVEYSRLADIWR
jgi:hypothetical protein